jgi:hypothetical protein
MIKEKTIILPSVYFGPVQYFSKILVGEQIVIEQYDTYSKQTYRNRCIIMSANGILSLSIPVKKIHGNRTKMKDILIDYDTSWQKDHERGIVSAYRSSPFFEFYFDDYSWVFSSRHKFLFDLNLKLTEVILSQLQIKNSLDVSKEYIDLHPENDLREVIHPKRSLTSDLNFKAKEYVQVFSSRHGFFPNLSIIDLLFNMGPEAKGILRQSSSI